MARFGPFKRRWTAYSSPITRFDTLKPPADAYFAAPPIAPDRLRCRHAPPGCLHAKKDPPLHESGPSLLSPGNDLRSQEVSLSVCSALEVFTSVFGMGTGVSPPLWSPDRLAFRYSLTRLRAPPCRCVHASLHSRLPYAVRHALSSCLPLLLTMEQPLLSGEALDRFVSVRSTYHYASTPDRSTLSSSRGLTLLSRWDTLS